MTSLPGTLASPLEIVTPPAAEPLTIAEAKAHLRVDTDAEDPYLDALIRAARASIEHETRRALITQTLRLHLDRFPCERTIWVPRPPLQSVSSITYTDTAGATQTLDAGSYHAGTASSPGRIRLAEAASWPSEAACRPGAVRVEFIAGYGAAAAVPEGLKHALRFLLAHWYAQREPVVHQSVNALPRALESLVWQYKVF